jgi:hypothetical protein
MSSRHPQGGPAYPAHNALTLPPPSPLPLSHTQARLPKAVPGGEPIPEGLMWLLLTGEVRPRKKRNEWGGARGGGRHGGPGDGPRRDPLSLCRA